MSENEQQEIVLGNKQLLSIFFLVVAMMGVAFTIGYIIGRNTAGVSAAGTGQTASPQSPVAGPSSPAKTDADPNAGQPQGTDSSKPDDSRSKPETSSGTQPARPYEGTPSRPAAQDAAPKETVGTAAAPASSKEVPAAAPASTIAGGSYLQVAAVKRQDGDHLVTVLRKRGFPALLGESPKEGLFRVLVGPFADMAALADSKQKLRAAGFEPVVAK